MPGNVQLVVGAVNYVTNLDPVPRLSGINRRFGITSQFKKPIILAANVLIASTCVDTF